MRWEEISELLACSSRPSGIWLARVSWIKVVDIIQYSMNHEDSDEIDISSGYVISPVEKAILNRQFVNRYLIISRQRWHDAKPLVHTRTSTSTRRSSGGQGHFLTTNFFKVVCSQQLFCFLLLWNCSSLLANIFNECHENIFQSCLLSLAIFKEEEGGHHCFWKHHILVDLKPVD